MTGTGYHITGTGLTQAIQKATSAKKDLVVVYDHDNFGRVLRIGYFFKEKGANTRPPVITWFKKGEIQIVAENNASKKFALDVDYTHSKDNERNFLLNLPLDKESRLILRHLFRVSKKSIVGFVMQVEIRRVTETEEWRPVIRYDCAHGFIHRDMIGSNGIKTKRKLSTQNVKDAISLASDEIRSNLHSWLQELGYYSQDKRPLNSSNVEEEMDRAKALLLELCDNPQKMKQTNNKFVQLKDGPDFEERIWSPK
jgi:hypothetical protein